MQGVSRSALWMFRAILDTVGAERCPQPRPLAARSTPHVTTTDVPWGQSAQVRATPRPGSLTRGGRVPRPQGPAGSPSQHLLGTGLGTRGASSSNARTRDPLLVLGREAEGLGTVLSRGWATRNSVCAESSAHSSPGTGPPLARHRAPQTRRGPTQGPEGGSDWLLPKSRLPWE